MLSKPPKKHTQQRRSLHGSYLKYLWRNLFLSLSLSLNVQNETHHEWRAFNRCVRCSFIACPAAVKFRSWSRNGWRKTQWYHVSNVFHYVGKLIDFFQKNIKQLIQECLSCGVSNLLLASNVMQLESVRLGFFRTVSDWSLSGVTDFSEMQNKIGQFSASSYFQPAEPTPILPYRPSFGVLGSVWL